MSTESDEFKWTPEITIGFFHMRLQHEWLFKKKKRAWNDFHEILMENGFPSNMTPRHIRNKWNYTSEEYHKALAQNNSKWLYFDLFQSYLSDTNLMEHYPNWTNDWISKLIELRIKHDYLFNRNTNNEMEAWNTVEFEIRQMGLPIECSVRRIEDMWFYIIKTYMSYYRFYSFKNAPKCVWPFYEPVKQYVESQNSRISLDSLLKPCRYKKKLCLDEESTSDEECLKDLKNKIIMKLEKEDYQVINDIKIEDDDFRWTQEWTESFIHIRLQNDALFKKKKRAWKDLHNIMMKNGFPEAMTVDRIRRKWIGTFEDYQKAMVLNNTKWLYYDIIHSYLGDTNPSDSFKNWSNEWIRRFIHLKLKTHLTNTEQSTDDDRFWMAVEVELRKEGIPVEFSIRNLHLIWTSLIKVFKVQHRYAKKNGEVSWPFYDHMKTFLEKCDPKILEKSVKLKEQNQMDLSDDDESFQCNDDFKNSVEEKPIKNEISHVICRACMGTSEEMIPIFESNDTTLSEKILSCTDVEVLQNDDYPQCLCQPCLQELNISYKFKKKCKDTDLILKATWTHKKEEIKKIKEEMPSSELFQGMIENDDDDVDADDNNCLLDPSSPVEIKIEEKHQPQILEVETKLKKKPCRLKEIKKHKKPITSQHKSKNIILIPIVKESGETVMKRKYVYWKVCEICGKSTQRMKEHMKGHSTEKTHKCNLCPKTFTYSASLQTHLRTHNTTPLKICQLCGREFFRNLTYKRHLVYHANERKYSCETCGKTFNTNDILRIHIRSHTGERPYACNTCGKTFYSRGCVSRHQKVHRKAGILKRPENCDSSNTG